MKLLLYYFTILLFASSQIAVFAENELPWIQNDWSGGNDQELWADATKFRASYLMNYETTGELSLNTNNDNGSVYDMIAFNSKIYVARSYGIFSYDLSSTTWKLEIPLATYSRQLIIINDKLYAVSGGEIIVNDKSSTDYGLGANGWSSITKQGLPTELNIFHLTELNNELYLSGVMWKNNQSSGGRVYKLTGDTWTQVGQQIANSATSICAHNNQLYCGTHWSGGLYQLQNNSWNKKFSTGMSIVKLYSWKDKLYIGSVNTNNVTGYLHEYDGSTFKQINSGAGIRYIAGNNTKLYFGGTGANKLFTYDGSQVSTTFTMTNKSTSLGGIATTEQSVYYGAGPTSLSSGNDNNIYKDGVSIADLHVGYLQSSTFELSEAKDWGNISFTTNSHSNGGIRLITQGKNKNQEWTETKRNDVKNHSSAKLDTEQGLYYILAWSTLSDNEIVCTEVSIGNELAPQSEFLPWIQTNWSAGNEQVNWDDENKFYSSYAVNYSKSGELSLSDKSEDHGVTYDMEVYQGALYVARAYGIFSYNLSTQNWDCSLPLRSADRDMIQHNDKLYGISSKLIMEFDGTSNDYGLGNNGWKPISNIGIPAEFTFFEAKFFNNELYASGVMWKNNASGGGRVYKLVGDTWQQVGQQISNSATSLAVYKDKLYCGTHWSGQIFVLDNNNWQSIGSQGMSVMEMKEWNNKLYIGTVNTNNVTGNLMVYDGSALSTVYSGLGVTKICTTNTDLYFGGQGKNSIFKLAGSSASTYSTMPSTSGIGSLTATSTDIYYGAGYVPNTTNNNIGIYKNQEFLNDLQAGYLRSSILSLEKEMHWGNVELDVTSTNGNGVELVTWGKSTSQTWQDTWYKSVIPNGNSELYTQEGLYYVLLWSTNTTSPICSEIRIGSSINETEEVLSGNIEVIKAFPNPCNHTLTISNLPNTESRFEIYTLSGKQIKQGYLTANSSEINTAEFQMGLYILSITNSGVHKTLKFIKR